MKIMNKVLKNYFLTILKLIFLTNLMCALVFWKNFHVWLGYLLGSLAVTVNFYFQAKGTEKDTKLTPGHAKKSVFKNFYVRYLILFAVLILIIKFLPVNLFALVAGVASLYLVIIIHGLIIALTKKNV